MLYHLPSMVHVVVALPVAVQATGQELLAMFPSRPTGSPRHALPPAPRGSWRGIAGVHGSSSMEIQGTSAVGALAFGGGIRGLAAVVGLPILLSLLLLLLGLLLIGKEVCHLLGVLTLHGMLLGHPLLHLLHGPVHLLLRISMLLRMAVLLLHLGLLIRIEVGVVAALVGISHVHGRSHVAHAMALHRALVHEARRVASPLHIHAPMMLLTRVASISHLGVLLLLLGIVPATLRHPLGS